MKKNKSTIFLILIFIVGLCLLLYPSVSNYWNSFHQSRAIASYEEGLSSFKKEDYSQLIGQVNAYNEKLFMQDETDYKNGKPESNEYRNLLDVNKNGMMGYITIDKINVNLPIYHGTADSSLSIATGHLEGSSLPFGGENTHCVITGHRGLPSAKLFSDLDQLQVGDTFTLNVLATTLTYEIDQVKIVEPYEINDITIEEGKDLCTLVTCTPYGVNAQRMLVRGRRIDNIEPEHAVRVTAEAFIIEPMVVAPVIAAPILLILALYLMLKPTNKKKK